MPNDYYTMLYTGEKTDELLQRVDEGEIILPSSTAGSTKKFKLTVDNGGDDVMVQGDAYSIDVEITNEGQALSPPAVSLVEIALLNLVKTYPGDVTFSDGKFHFPLTQTETFGLPTVCPMQVRVKFPSGDVIGSEMQRLDVKRALSRKVI